METVVETVEKVEPMVTSRKKRDSRKKRGRVATKRTGWGILNRETKYLVEEFFSRRTDVISRLEKEEKKPWSQLKRESPLTPVRIEIKVTELVEETM